MNDFAFACTALPPASTHRLPTWLSAQWQSLPMLERRVVAAGGAVSLVLVAALALTCQASVSKGERFRAEQRQAAAAVPAVLQAAAAAPLRPSWS
jgi:hypothetical protein